MGIGRAAVEYGAKVFVVLFVGAVSCLRAPTGGASVDAAHALGPFAITPLIEKCGGEYEPRFPEMRCGM